jgi:hypothetical protein
MIADIPTGAWIVLLGAAVGWYSTLDYAIAIVRGRLRPSLASWGVWTTTASIGTVAAASMGSTVGAVISGATAVRCGQVFVPALGMEIREWWRARHGRPPLVVAEPHTRSQRILDLVCLTACAGIGGAWWATADDTLALALAIAVDGIACLPTIWHGCQGKEHPKPYLLGMVGPVIALLVVRQRMFMDYAWPLYELLVNILMAVPPLLVGWPGGRARARVGYGGPAALAVFYLAMTLLVFTVIPPPGGQWAAPWRTGTAWPTLASGVALAILAVAVAPRIWAVLRGRVAADPIVWSARALLGIVAFAAQLTFGGATAIVQVGALAAVAVLTAAAAGGVAATGRAPRSDLGGLTWRPYLDVVCTLGAGAAFCVLLLTGARNAMLTVVVVNLFAFVPVVVVAWRAPFSQSHRLVWGIVISTWLALLAGGPPARLIEVGSLLSVFALAVVLALVIAVQQWRLDPTRRPAATPPWEAPTWPESRYGAYLRATTPPTPTPPTPTSPTPARPLERRPS